MFRDSHHPFFDGESHSVSRKRKRSQPPDKNSDCVQIYWDRLYRYVENYDHLFGQDVHVSKGELGCASLDKDTDYKIVPFSHTGSTGALFEMQELEEDMLCISAKLHQPGTGVASYFSKDCVEITRIFYHPNEINPELLKKITALSKKKDVSLVKIDFSDYLTDKLDKIELVQTECKRRRIGLA